MTPHGAPALNVRAAEPADTPEMVALLNRTFRTPLPEEVWLWYTRHNPLGPSRLYVAEEAGAGRLVGVIGFAPMPYRLEGTAISGVYGHHLAFEPAYRDTLSYLALCGHALSSERRHGVELILGPPNRRAYPVHKVLGKWFDFGYLDCLRKVPPFAEAHDCEELERFPEGFDSFYKQVTSGWAFCVEKTAAWANWRFRERPDAPYTVYAVRDAGNLAGYVVLKRWQDPDGYRKVHILEIQALGDAALARLIAAAESYAAGCNELNLWAIRGYPYRSALQAAGFQSSHRQPLLARTLNRPALPFPTGSASLGYGDGDSQY
jgi:hypothetical protein